MAWKNSEPRQAVNEQIITKQTEAFTFLRLATGETGLLRYSFVWFGQRALEASFFLDLFGPFWGKTKRTYKKKKYKSLIVSVTLPIENSEIIF